MLRLDKRDLLLSSPTLHLAFPCSGLNRADGLLVVDESIDVVATGETLDGLGPVLPHALLQVARHPDVEASGAARQDVDGVLPHGLNQSA